MEINDLCVDYDDFVAVGDLSLTMPRGEVMGWVGPNGVGKTSTFRVMTMLMDPTYCEDEALLNGYLVEAPDASSILEKMPDRSTAHSSGNHLVLVFLERGLSLGIFVELYTLVVSTAVLYHITVLVAVMKNHRLAFLMVQASEPLVSEF